MPKFSIIVGMYNQLATLPMLITALEQQSYKNFEVIFCDDGSTDGTEQWLAEQPLNFRHRYIGQKNKGYRLAKNLNNGIRKATGDYCTVIMADSFPDTDYLETLLQYVQPHRVVCGIRIQIDNGVGVDMDYRIKKEIIPQENTVVMGRPWNALTGNGITYPTQALRDVGLYDESIEGYGGEDTELIARMFFRGYVMWSVVDARLFHHWHKTKDSLAIPAINKKIYQHSL